MIPCLGVDPGSRSGAAVLLHADGRRVLAWWVWLKMDRLIPCYRVRLVHGVAGGIWKAESHELDRLWKAADRIDEAVYYITGCQRNTQLVIEGLFVGRRDGSLRVQDALVLAEGVGEFRAGLGWTGGLPELRPLASVWRKQVLGLKARTKKDQAEAYAVEWAPKLFDWSACPWDAHDLTKAERGALAEAACMARWGVSMRKYDDGLREALGDLEQA